MLRDSRLAGLRAFEGYGLGLRKRTTGLWQASGAFALWGLQGHAWLLKISGVGAQGCRLSLWGHTHRPLSSSFWGLPYRILNISHKTGTT